MWQLQPEVVVPALRQLSVCVLLRHTVSAKWTGFVYKAPQERQIQLGIEGSAEKLEVWLFGKKWPLQKKLKLDEWYSICLTWSGQAQRLRTYINGTMLLDESLKNSTRQKLILRGTLTLGVSHFVHNDEVQPESGTNLIGNIGLFRMWGREFSAEELLGLCCADGDVVSWDQRQWKYACPPQPDDSLHCACSRYKIKMGVIIVDSTSHGNYSESFEEITRNWLENTFQSNISVQDIYVLSTSFSCEVYVHVNPAAYVKVVQTDITSLLTLTFNYNFLTLTADPNSIFILPVEITNHLPPDSSAVTTSESPTQTASARPANMSTTREPLDVNHTAVRPDLFFRVNYTLRVTGNAEKPKDIIEKWVKEQLEVNKTMAVLNFLMIENRNGKLNIETDTTSWANPNLTNCDPLSISDLSNVTVTPDNAAEVVDMIQDLVDVRLGNSDHLSSSELGLVVEKLSEVVDLGMISPDVGADIVNIVGNVLLSETDVASVANILLNLTDGIGNCMDFQGEYASITAPSLALSMVNVDPGYFIGLTFGVSLSSTMNPEVVVNQSFVSEPLSETNATISLPSQLNNFFPPGGRNTTRVQFQFYGTQDLFKDPNITNVTQSSLTLNSYIVSASINNSRVINLEDRVVVTLKHKNPKQPGDSVQCGQGGWNSSGCETQSISPYQTSCLCDHLTHFAVLLDVSGVPISEADSQILTLISYLGCGISAIFLGLTLLTYLFFEKLRQDYPSKILINLSAALLGLNMIFLLNSWLSSFSNSGLCITTAVSLHYFLLASFTWMGLEAVHMYFALVKVFNTYVRYYILKFCAVGWGIPLVIVSLVLAIDKDAYGSLVPEEAALGLQSGDQFCWLKKGVSFYVTVLAFIFVILLCNMSVFIVVLIQIKRMGANKQTANSRTSQQDFRAVVSLTVLLGLTWSIGFFSFGPGRVVMMYVFSICNSVQGLFLFLFHCAMKENVKKEWRIHLCCGRFRLSDNSDWSRSVTGGDHSKKDHLSNSDSAASENTSSLRSLTRNSTRGQ
ncbi:adhesion G-protein coupled receptor G2 [Odontesthes bonariensis]